MHYIAWVRNGGVVPHMTGNQIYHNGEYEKRISWVLAALNLNPRDTQNVNITNNFELYKRMTSTHYCKG